MNCDEACEYHCTKNGTQKKDCIMNYNDYIEYVESNKIGYNLKRENNTVILSSKEGDKVFNFENKEVV